MQAAYRSWCRFRSLRLCSACGSNFRWYEEVNQEERSVCVGARLTDRKVWAVDSRPVLRISMWLGFWSSERLLLITGYHITDTQGSTECLWSNIIIQFLNEYEFINKATIHLPYLVSLSLRHDTPSTVSSSKASKWEVSLFKSRSKNSVCFCFPQSA